MNDARLLEALRASTSDVLEKMFFVRAFADPAAKPGSAQIAAMLTFTGETPGWLKLEVGAATAREIAGDFLAEEAATLTDGQVEEVVCELANMLCGSAISRLEPGSLFRLSTPRIVAPGESHGKDRDATIHTVEAGHGALTAAMGWGTPLCRPAAERAY